MSYAGDFGTGNPESVLIQRRNYIFRGCRKKGCSKAIQQGLGSGIRQRHKLSVEEKIDRMGSKAGKTIISGYDPEDNNYLSHYLQRRFLMDTPLVITKEEVSGRATTFLS